MGVIMTTRTDVTAAGTADSYRKNMAVHIIAAVIAEK